MAVEKISPMALGEEQLVIAGQVADALALPAVRGFYVNLQDSDDRRSSKFGAMLLEDGTVGLTYVDIGQGRQEFLGV